MGSVPADSNQPPLSEEDKNLVMHVSLPILGGHRLMGTDAPESMGFKLNQGNNVYINLQPDTRSEADKLFKALSEGGKVEMEMQEMFWGDYFGSFADKFGVKWMVNTSSKK
jgi:PhnB protein